jgi:cytochrome c oxidase cbb3-type subunit 3
VNPDEQEPSSSPAAQHGVHVYDDIVEEDNRLPRWWVWILFGTAAFATFYWYGDQELKAWGSPRAIYDDQMIAIRLAEASKGGGMSADALLSLSHQTGAVANGKETFVTTCAPCHRADGGGGIGPNLTDEYWLHGSHPDQIWKTVHDGVPSKGMAAWGAVLGETRVASAVAYVLTLKNTNVPNGKAPQGDPEP